MGFGEYGIIGCGPWGLRLLSVLRRCFDERLVGHVADLRPERLAAAARIDPTVCLHASHESLLQSPGLTGILVATPTPTHGDLVEAGLERGLDVYVEKVLSMDLAQAGRIEGRALREGARLQLGLPWQHGPVATALRGLLDRGTLGALRSLQATRVGASPLRRSEGVIWDLLPHDVAMVLQAMGRVPQAVRVREAVQEAAGAELVAVTVELGLDDRVVATLRASWVEDRTVRSWVLEGEAGTARVDEIERRRDLRLDGETLAADTDEPLEEALRAFLLPAADPGRAAPGCWGVDLSRVLATAAEAANCPGRWLPILPLPREVGGEIAAA
ncbi:MAG: Gfo/Idh/MocA family oxidoreductase [Deltaproteobacteria bacterium]|nr:Gfo/Idh/MocA family oxidoreductase [Deltaproteobacteria bacterium]